MAEPFAWNCPFCGRDTTITDSYREFEGRWFTVPNAEGPRRVVHSFIVCPNPQCRKTTFGVALWEVVQDLYASEGFRATKILKSWRLIPGSGAKAFPDYVPGAIRQDYEEACAIRDLSPKASATLSRRCLQGMIRDFWNVKKRNLAKAIDAIKGKVDPNTWKAIDAVRKVGNIGAHMEKDINLIVDVEPKEAGKLIALIELLIKDWYIGRHDREEAVEAVVQVAQAKDQAKKPATTEPTGAPPASRPPVRTLLNRPSHDPST